MPVRPFTLLGRSELAALAQHLNDASSAWAQRWGLAAPAPAQLCAADAAPPLADSGWLAARRGTASAHAGLAQRAVLATLVFGDQAGSRPSALADAVAELMLVDLLARCLPGDGPVATDDPVPAAQEQGRASGALQVLLPLAGGSTLCWLLGGGAVRAWRSLRTAPAAPALAPRNALLDDGRITLAGWLGGAEIDIGTLQALALGDVIRLDLRIDQPLQLTVAGLRCPHRAWLGRQGAQRALRLTGPHDDHPDEDDAHAF